MKLTCRRMTFFVVLLPLGMLFPALLHAGGPTAGESRKSLLPELKVEKYTLDNGLTVVLHENHMAPLVAVNVTYNAGSKDDPPGRSGLAHIVEHLMFDGSLQNPQGHHAAMYGFMTQYLGSTTADSTVYYTTVSRDALEYLLWAEADRMGFLVAELTTAKLENQRAIVRNERREKIDNVPTGEAVATQRNLLYPVGHPYDHETVGSMASISAIQLDDVCRFYSQHYVPNNAFLCVVGDFDSVSVKPWIRKYFGPLQRAPLAKPPKPDDLVLPQRRRVTLTDQQSYSNMRLIWKTVPAGHPDEAALDVLAAVLAGAGRSARLYRSLVEEKQLATGVDAAHENMRLAGTLLIEVFAKSGQSLAEPIGVIEFEIERLKKDAPTPSEVRKAQIARERFKIMQLESVTSAASVLNYGAATYGDPLAYQTEISRMNAVTPQDVSRVARKYLGSARVEIDILPGEHARPRRDVALAPLVPVRKYTLPLMKQDLLSIDPEMPGVEERPDFLPPRFERRKLSNGLALRIVEQHDLPIVSLNLVLKSGETSSPKGKEGLCSIVLAMLSRGTKSRDARQLEEQLTETGASNQLDGWLEWSSINVIALTPYLGQALDLFADEILNPTFPEDELRRQIHDRLFGLSWRPDYADHIADDVLPRLLYGANHPYGRPYRGTADSIKSISRDDVVAFYKQTFVPGNAELVVVGDVPAKAITDALEARLGRWPASPAPKSPDVSAKPISAAQGTAFLIDRAGAVQSTISVGGIGAALKSADRFIVRFAQHELGGRVDARMCAEKGYTYGLDTSSSLRKGPGTFTVTGAVQTEATQEALAEILKAMTDVTGPVGVTQEGTVEIQDAMVAQRFARFETIQDISREVSYLVSHDLPDDDFSLEVERCGAVTKDDVDRVCKQYLKPEQMTILVVGDRSKIVAPLKSLPFVKTIRLLDAEGNPIGDALVPNPVSKDKETRPAP